MSRSQKKERLRKAVFLDRDGTIIVDKVYLNDPEQIEFLPLVFQGLKKLQDDGFLFFVVTNQSGVPRGLVQIENLNEIHRRIGVAMAERGIEINQFYYAPFLTDSNHFSRKPNPGMLLQAAQEHEIQLEHSWMIGDHMLDVEAGHRSGARSILLKRGEKEVAQSEWPGPEAVCDDLLQAADYILDYQLQMGLGL